MFYVLAKLFPENPIFFVPCVKMSKKFGAKKDFS
jgi:hypothetical protein